MNDGAEASFYRLLIGALITWRLTHLLNAEDGPGGVLVRLRKFLGDGWIGQLSDCFYCLSLWIGLAVACCLARDWRDMLPLGLALSGAASLFERFGQLRTGPESFPRKE